MLQLVSNAIFQTVNYLVTNLILLTLGRFFNYYFVVLDLDLEWLCCANSRSSFRFSPSGQVFELSALLFFQEFLTIYLYLFINYHTQWYIK